MCRPMCWIDDRQRINISGGEFRDFVAGDKSVKVKGDYVKNQENLIDPPSI
jgi:hypothetical protein